MEKNKLSWIITIFLALLLLAGMVFAVYLFKTINTQIDAAFSPIHQTNRTLGTQVASLLHPTPTIIPDPVTIIRQVQSLARLETIQYTVEKVITAEVNQGVFGSLFGDRLLLVAHGNVIAGIDLNKLGSTDLWLEGDILKVRLPTAEIFSATLDNEQSYVYDRTTGLFTQGDPGLETAARQIAERRSSRPPRRMASSRWQRRMPRSTWNGCSTRWGT